MSGKTVEEVREALIKISFKSNAGKGVRVCYPNEVLVELYGKDVLDKLYIPEEIKPKGWKLPEEEKTIQSVGFSFWHRDFPRENPCLKPLKKESMEGKW